jgi:hypothetical protein
MLLVLVAAVVVLIAGPSQDQTPAAVILALILFLLVARPAGTRFAMSRTLDARREAHDDPPGTSEEPSEHDAVAGRPSERGEQPGGE